MLLWILIIVVSLIAIIFVLRLITSKDINSSSKVNFDLPNTEHTKSVNNATPTIKQLKAVDVLSNVEAIKERQEFNWLKLHQNINPEEKSSIETKLTKLIREEREHIIVDKFIYYAKLNPNDEILQILDKIEKNTISYQKILSNLGNK